MGVRSKYYKGILLKNITCWRNIEKKKLTAMVGGWLLSKPNLCYGLDRWDGCLFPLLTSCCQLLTKQI
jgi:hypothetical protein